MIMTLNTFIRRFIALITCLCLAVSSTSVVWAQTGSNNTITLGHSSFSNDSGIQLFLAQADTSSLGFDITAPTISHSPSISKGIAGEMQTVVAEISDNQAVARAVLTYRNSSEDFYSSTEMSADVTNTTWLATLDTTADDTLVHYFIVAEDSDGNRVQKGSESNPLTLSLQQADYVGGFAPVKTKNNRTTWLAIGISVIAVGALLLAGGGSGGNDNDGIVSSDGDQTCCTITFIVPNVNTQ